LRQINSPLRGPDPRRVRPQRQIRGDHSKQRKHDRCNLGISGYDALQGDADADILSKKIQPEILVGRRARATMFGSAFGLSSRCTKPEWFAPPEVPLGQPLNVFYLR